MEDRGERTEKLQEKRRSGGNERERGRRGTKEGRREQREDESREVTCGAGSEGNNEEEGGNEDYLL